MTPEEKQNKILECRRILDSMINHDMETTDQHEIEKVQKELVKLSHYFIGK